MAHRLPAAAAHRQHRLEYRTRVRGLPCSLDKANRACSMCAMASQIRPGSWNHLAAVLAILTILMGLWASSSFASAPTATASCSATVPKPTLTDQRAGVRSSVVPGKPGVLLGCRYVLQPAQGSTDGSALVSADLLSPFRYAPALNAAKPAKDAPSCPASEAVIALIFRYPDGSRVLVTVQPDGCRIATNGTRTVVAPRALITQLNASLGGA
jgi:hypothetical protein